MKIAILLLIPMILAVSGAYPIPVDCANKPHEPTISSADISQSFGHLDHVGLDYKVPAGTEVYAVMDGIVIQEAGDSRVYGRYVMILHCDGYASLYAHLSMIDVRFGEVVSSGDVIGLSGGDLRDNIDGDGWSSGAHLHFEVRVPGHLENNLYNIDPLEYMDMAGRYGRLPAEV